MIQTGTAADLKRAAQILNREAFNLAKAYTVAADGVTFQNDLDSRTALHDVLEYRALAKRLKALATRGMK